MATRSEALAKVLTAVRSEALVKRPLIIAACTGVAIGAAIALAIRQSSHGHLQNERESTRSIMTAIPDDKGHEHSHEMHGHQHDNSSSDACCNHDACCTHGDEKAGEVSHNHSHSTPNEPPPCGPPPLGAILSLAKETNKPRAACKAALIAHANDYEAAKASLLPPALPEEPPPPSGEVIPGVYEPAAKFDGGRPGWMFKHGNMGLGYYRDAPMAVAVPKKG